MELKQFAEELKGRMNAQIDGISMDQPDALSRTSQLIACIEKYVHELKLFVIKYKFKGIGEEIEFFKLIKPGFLSALLYNQRLFQIQLFEAFSDQESRAKFYQKNLNKLGAYLDKNMEFYQYVLSNQGHLDEKYFTRLNVFKIGVEADERFSTPYDFKLSKLLCNQLLQGYLVKSIQKLNNRFSSDSSSTLTWTGSKTDLVELVYALHVSGVFNKSSADVKQIATHFENVFNVTLGNYYRTFQEIKIRKTGQVNFISHLKEGLIKRISEDDL